MGWAEVLSRPARLKATSFPAGPVPDVIMILQGNDIALRQYRIGVSPPRFPMEVRMLTGEMKLSRRQSFGFLGRCFLFFAFIILGRSLFRSRINHSAIFSACGVADSLVVILIWIYYMAAGYFIGAAVSSEFHGNRNQTEFGVEFVPET